MAKSKKISQIEETKMPSEKPLSRRCGAKIRRSFEKHGKQMYCALSAGYGTDHKGSGRCKYHGGCSTGRHGIKRGKRILKSNYKDELKIYDEISNRNILDIEDELINLKFLFKYFFDYKIVDEENYDKMFYHTNMLTAIKFALAISKVTGTMFNLKYDDKSKFQINVFNRLIDIILIVTEKIYNNIHCNHCHKKLNLDWENKTFKQAMESAIELALDTDRNVKDILSKFDFKPYPTI